MAPTYDYARKCAGNERANEASYVTNKCAQSGSRGRNGGRRMPAVTIVKRRIKSRHRGVIGRRRKGGKSRNRAQVRGRSAKQSGARAA